MLGSGDVDAMWALAETPGGADDVELTERLIRTLPDRDPRHAALSSRLAALASVRG